MLSRRDIEKELGKGINIYPLVRDNFKENSINLSASKYAWTLGGATVFWNGNNKFSLVEESNKKGAVTFRPGSACIYHHRKKQKSDEYEEFIILLPHSTTLVETEEVLGVEKYIGGAVHSKVGLAAKGIGHLGTMLGPGFCGHLLLSLHNVTDQVIALRVGDTCASLSFDYLSTQVARSSTTVSGHVDKFAELGVQIDEDTRKYLTDDWKANIEGIRMRMCESQEYKDYKKYIRTNIWKEFKKYVNKRNIIATLASVICVMILYCIASRYDAAHHTTIWVDRFWNVGFSGILGSFVISLWNFLKDKK